jgi:hypothetical protein
MNLPRKSRSKEKSGKKKEVKALLGKDLKKF